MQEIKTKIDNINLNQNADNQIIKLQENIMTNRIIDEIKEESKFYSLMILNLFIHKTFLFIKLDKNSLQDICKSEENLSKSKNEMINIIINKNVFNLSNQKIEKKYMKHLLVSDFLDTKSNNINFFKNSNNDKINEKYIKHLNKI